MRIEPLQAPVPAELSGMTFPAYRHLLNLKPVSRHPEQGDERLVAPLGYVAWRGVSPVGLILGELPVDSPESPTTDVRTAYGGRPELLSVFVRADARWKGIAGQLFEAFEVGVRERGFGEIAATYMTGKAGIEGVERILARRGWQAPQSRTLSLRLPLDKLLANPPLPRAAMSELARKLDIFPWSELSRAELESLKQTQRERPWIAPGLVPWKFEHGLDASSLGARYEGNVVGWVLNHRVSETVVRLTCAHMREDLSRWAMLAPVFYASLDRLAETPCQTCTFVTPFSYGTMIEAIQRYWVPIASSVSESRGTRLILSPE